MGIESIIMNMANKQQKQTKQSQFWTTDVIKQQQIDETKQQQENVNEQVDFKKKQYKPDVM